MDYQELNRVINQAAEVVGKTWPLYGFVTANPLSGYESLPFFTALKKAGPVLGGQTLPAGDVFRQAWQEKKIDVAILQQILAAAGIKTSADDTLLQMESKEQGFRINDNHGLDRLTVKWLSLFLDEGQAAWPMPFKDMGFYTAWRKLIIHDNDVIALARKSGQRMTAIPKTPEEAIGQVLINFAPEAYQQIFERHFAALPGWVGFIKYRIQNNADWLEEYPISLLDYLAVRLWMAMLTGATIMPEVPEQTDTDKDVRQLQQCWLEAWEKSWQQQFFAKIQNGRQAYELSVLKDRQKVPGPDANTMNTAQAAAQLVFCLDTRSERLRRMLEQVGASDREDRVAGCTARYETFGSAGAFGLLMDYQNPETGLSHKSSPAMAPSKYLVREMPVAGKQEAVTAYLQEGKRLGSYRYFLKRMKNILPSAFGFVEGSGLYYGAFLLLRLWSPNRADRWLLKHHCGYEGLYEPHITPVTGESSAEAADAGRSGISKVGTAHKNKPGGSLLRDDLEAVDALKLYAHDFVQQGSAQEDKEDSADMPLGDRRQPPDELSVEGAHTDSNSNPNGNAKPDYRHKHGHSLNQQQGPLQGIDGAEKAAIVKGTFDSCGWRSFSPLVVFTGHASKSANNPFASSLDCGACAGQPGKHNARTLARLANDTKVREILKEQHGILIPESTFFIAAEHITSTDEVRLFDQEVPASHAALVEQLKQDLEQVRHQLTKERLGEPTDAARIARIKSNSWSESRPEWGLSGHKGYIIGPRYLTINGQFSDCFMSSYDWQLDPDGSILKGIMQGPLVVVQWISNHYYFSTVDNQKFGGGSKIIHNITGKHGVVEGNGGDLKVGLPLQSVMKSDTERYHEPIRITTLIQAPRRYIDQILNEDAKLKSLIQGGWILLFIMDPEQQNQVEAYV